MTEILQGKKFKCAFCGGTGVQPRSLKSRCLPCRGKGEVEFGGPVIQCPSCRGKGRASSSSSMLSCIHCGGVGVAEKSAKGGDVAEVIEERLGEITKRLQWTRKETEKKTKEIEKRLKPVKPFIKEISAIGGSALGGKKETLKYSKLTSGQAPWLEKLGNNLKRGWESLWEQ